MPDAVDLYEWNRIAALIEECRAEREACASVRRQLTPIDVASHELYVGTRERLLAGVGDISASTAQDDATS